MGAAAVRAADHPYFDAPTPIALAHRGGAAYAPNRGLENTLAAFREAVALGYRYLETDVHATRDGYLVAFHDTHLDRVTDGSGAIADLPYAAVRAARVGGAQSVPLLSEMLEELPEARVNIDVKSWPALAPTIETLRRANALHRVCLGSFDEKRVRAARAALGPRLATAAGPVGTAAMRFTAGPLAQVVHSPAPVFQVPWRHEVAGRWVTVVTPGFMRRAHRLGKHVHVWFHSWADDRAERMEALLDLGVDGIVTDHLDVLRDVLRRRGAWR